MCYEEPRRSLKVIFLLIILKNVFFSFCLYGIRSSYANGGPWKVIDEKISDALHRSGAT